MYERLKHLIISSEAFRNKMKTGYGVRVETKLDGKGKKDKLLGSEEQEEFQTMISSHSLSKDKSTNGRTIGIPDNQICWQIIMLIVKFWLLYSVLSSSSINRQNFDKVGKIKSIFC